MTVIKITWKPSATIDDRINLFEEIWKNYIFYTSKENADNNKGYWTPNKNVWFALKYPE